MHLRAFIIVFGLLISIVSITTKTEAQTNESHFQKLIEQTRSENVFERREAINTLVEWKNPRTASVLIECLIDNDIEVRRMAALGLGEIRARLAFWALTKAMMDPERGIQQEAATAIAKLNVKDGFDVLYRGLRDERIDTQRWTIYTLGEMRHAGSIDIVAPYLANENVYLRLAAIDALTKIGEVVVEPLITIINDTTDELLIENALRTLSIIATEECIDIFLKYLNHENPVFGRYAAQGLGNTRSQYVIFDLQKALGNMNKLGTDLSENQILKKCAIVEGMGRIWDYSSLDPLIQLISNDDEPRQVVHYATIALGRIGNHRAAVPLAKLLLREDRVLHIIAGEALERVVHVSSAPILVEVFHKHDTFRTQIAIEALKRIGKPAAAALVQGRVSEDDYVRCQSEQVWAYNQYTEQDLIDLDVAPPFELDNIEAGRPTKPTPPQVVHMVPDNTLSLNNDDVPSERCPDQPIETNDEIEEPNESEEL